MRNYEEADCAIRTIYGDSRLRVFSFGPNEQDNVLTISVPGDNDVPFVRVQSACYTGEIFRSTDCDCHEQLDESMRLIHKSGGHFIYMLADGRGAGLLAKLRGLALGETEGLDTFDAYVRLGVPTDPRNYSQVLEVLDALDIRRARLLTNNPRKASALSEHGIEVDAVPLRIAPTADSVAYLETKRRKFGHTLAPASEYPEFDQVSEE